MECNSMRRFNWQLAIFVGLLASVARSTENWPQFRGSDALNAVENASERLPDSWSPDQNVRWSTDLPGRGWSSPITWGDRVFLTTVVNSGESEAPKKGLYFGGDRPEPPATPHQWKVYCLDLNTGAIRWEQVAHEGLPPSPIHLKNSYASETPVTDGERIYALFGNVGLYCYDLDGHQLWKHELPVRQMRYGWGSAASPALHDGRVYLVNDNEEESYLECLDARTGEQLWKMSRDEKSNWSTPFVWQNELRTEIVTAGTDRVRSYDVDGKLLYEFGGMSSITIAQPFSQHGLLYVSSGYVLDKKRPLLAIKPGASGDITLADDATSSDFIAWCQPEAAPYNPTTLVYGDLLYVLLDRGFLACYDAHSGELVYDRQRLPDGQAFTASPWAFRGKVFCLSEDGVTFVVEAGRNYKLLHTNRLEDDDMCMATPAIAGDNLLIRTAARLYCLQQSEPARVDTR
jgi:outer membrane protein assembly factor BamB